jgi:phospholipase C
MRNVVGFLCALAWFGWGSAQAQIASFQHIVVIVQENRTPDNLFQGLCSKASLCSSSPATGQYDIQTSGWLNKKSPNRLTGPVPVPLANTYDLAHSHSAFVVQCDLVHGTSQCLMDGAAGIGCIAQKGNSCPENPGFAYVDNSTGILNPYLTLATQYGWANYMFQTNQGPSYPAHQFLFGATSAPSAADDSGAIFASENIGVLNSDVGCSAAPTTVVQLIDPTRGEEANNKIFPCFEHSTIADILTQSGYTWRYYTPLASMIWTAPNSINHICLASNQVCEGSIWKANVDLTSSDVLKDIGNCALRNVSWVIPSAQNSDHASANTGGGPSWVASIVNAIGNSRCSGHSGKTYWQTTAILIIWDDWGGWYDHAAPTILPGIQGDYQYGFRVPFIVVSAYTPKGYIDNERYDFGSIARFIEQNFLIQEGDLNFADARSTTDLTRFFRLKSAPRSFNAISAPLDAKHFLNDKSPPLPPDND